MDSRESKIINKTPYTFLVLLAFLPLLNVNTLSILIFLFYFFAIVFRTKIIKENFQKIGFKPLIINVLFYIPLIVSLTYTPVINKGLDVIVREISFLLMPLVLFYSLKTSKKLLKTLSFIFILSNTLVVIYLSLKLNLFGVFLDNPSEFFNQRFYIDIVKEDYKDWHPTYIGLNNLVSTLILLNYIFKTSKVKHKTFAIIIVFVFLVFSLILNSRVIFFINLIILPLFVILKLKKIKYKIVTVAIGFIALLLLFNISKTNRLGRIFIEPINKDVESVSFKKLFGVRYAIQECSLELISDKPILGYGVGYEKVLLPIYCLEIKNFKNQYLNNNYSSHSVYLFLLFSAGILGLLPFLFLMSNNLVLSIKKRDLMYASILIIFTLVFLTENYFIRINGILLFSFLNSLYYQKNSKYIEKEK
ncbi:MAG: O-antigen ligase family protein [Winogradskyella sp.]|uniref:O-antigen ligase family protein n=1 Tax=Winogradskyella sp. TaxID=1883156 RepID=UPI001843AABC|nr:O-antigen ligase family protein [Winogradskyella sp.]MBT8243805.1 O-antigen ligase family protein [Winogradskyella sp.]NNK23413.1 O-antigen ligase family protein [Winogradskyella sp.]